MKVTVTNTAKGLDYFAVNLLVQNEKPINKQSQSYYTNNFNLSSKTFFFKFESTI